MGFHRIIAASTFDEKSNGQSAIFIMFLKFYFEKFGRGGVETTPRARKKADEIEIQ